MGIFLNDAEQAVLDRLDYIYEALYRRGIRRYMDKTGLVGINQSISWEVLGGALCLPFRSHLGRKKSLSKEQIIRLAHRLEKSGLISIKNQSNELIIKCCLATVDAIDKEQLITSPAYSSDNKVATDDVVITYKRKKNITSKKLNLIETPSWLSIDDWEAFLSHRKSIKAPMSEIAQRRAISELQKLKAQGNPPSDVINQSIVQGWKGVFPIRKTDGGLSCGKNSRFNNRTENISKIIGDKYDHYEESCERDVTNTSVG